MTKAIGLGGLILLLTASTNQAADVEVKGAHLCCPLCIKAVGATLKKVEGVTDAACDKDAKTIKFKATNPRVARRALRRLSNTGFYGKATVDGKAAKLPKSGAKKGQKSDKITVRNVHICCRGCQKAIGAALKDVNGVDGIKCDGKKGTVLLTGTQFEVLAAITALNKAGFSGRVGVSEKK